MTPSRCANSCQTLFKVGRCQNVFQRLVALSTSKFTSLTLSGSMKHRSWIYVIFAAVYVVLQYHVQQVSSSVIGIDYGTEWMKVSIVKLGVPLDIVLNTESKRKTPSVVSLRHGIRYFESAAVAAVSHLINIKRCRQNMSSYTDHANSYGHWIGN